MTLGAQPSGYMNRREHICLHWLLGQPSGLVSHLSTVLTVRCSAPVSYSITVSLSTARPWVAQSLSASLPLTAGWRSVVPRATHCSLTMWM